MKLSKAQIQSLNQTEREILKHIMTGAPLKEIAYKMGYSYDGFKGWYMYLLYKKLGIEGGHNNKRARVQALLYNSKF